MMYKNILFLAIILILNPVSAFSQITYDSKQKLLSVKSQGGLLSILLSEISAKTKVDVYINPALDRKVFVDIKNKPLDEAIKDVVKPLNYTFVYRENRIKSVKVFLKSETEATQKITPSASHSLTPSPSVTKDLTQKPPLTRQELEALAQERRRQKALSEGKLKEFEEKEAVREQKRKRRELKREERRKEREAMRLERKKKRQMLESQGVRPPREERERQKEPRK